MWRACCCVPVGASVLVTRWSVRTGISNKCVVNVQSAGAENADVPHSSATVTNSHCTRVLRTAAVKNGTRKWPRNVCTLQPVLKLKPLSVNGDVRVLLIGFSVLEMINWPLVGGTVTESGNCEDSRRIFYRFLTSQ